MYIIDHGEVQITEVRPDGWTRSFTLNDGGVFGERALVDYSDTTIPTLHKNSRFVSAIAKHDTTCIRINKQMFDQLASTFPLIKSEERLSILRHCQLFSRLNTFELEQVKMAMHVTSFQKGDVLMEQGDETDGNSELFVVLDGAITRVVVYL
jgi:CRP-like cAMP-binding protein|eukprot:COSAG01_NODE_1903_length_8958_cov_6.750536_4_plen_152_part_00